MTRLELLCKAHNVQGGTIFQYNKHYGLNFLNLSEEEFNDFLYALHIKQKFFDIKLCKDLNCPCKS